MPLKKISVRSSSHFYTGTLGRYTIEWYPDNQLLYIVKSDEPMMDIQSDDKGCYIQDYNSNWLYIWVTS